MAARVVQAEGRKYDGNNWLLIHTMGANTGGQIGSVMAAAIMLSVLKGMELADSRTEVELFRKLKMGYNI